MRTGNEIKQELYRIGIEANVQICTGSMRGNALVHIKYAHKLSNKDISEILNENGFRDSSGGKFREDYKFNSGGMNFYCKA